MVPTSTVLAAVAVVALITSPAPAPPVEPPSRSSSSQTPSSTLTPTPTPTSTPTGVSGAAAAAGRTWGWPLLPRPDVIRRFDVGPERWSAGHRGVDLAARPGAVVRAPTAGVVRFVGVVAGRPVLSLALDDGLVTSFEPVTSTLAPGEAAAAGAVIGMVSALPGHCFPGTCVHWGVRRGETYLDPLLFVRGVLRPIVLKPLAGLG